MTNLRDRAPSATPTTSAAPMTLALAGEIDLANAGEIRAAADLAVRRGVPGVIVDLRDVSFMDSEGLKTLLLARQELREAGVPLVLRHPSTYVRQLLEIAGLEEAFDIV